MKALMIRLFCAAAVACAISPAFAQTDTTKPATPPASAQPKPEQPKTDPKAEAPKPAAEKVAWVEIKTSMGTIVVELDGEKAPISTTNFLAYVNEGFYDGTIFHRVIKNFMIQGGGFTDKSSTEVAEKKTTHPSIKNEWQNGLKNKRGTIAMARTGDPDSATSQFYINVVDNDRPGGANLDAPRGAPGAQAAYAVFGKVISGMDVVDKIKEVATGYKEVAGAYKSRMPDVPTTTVTIEKARKLTEEEAKKVKRDEPGSAPAPAPAPKTAPAPAPATPPKPKTGGG